MRRHYMRGAIVAAVALALVPWWLAPAKEPIGPAHYTGKVVPLKDVLEKSGIRLDRDADPAWLALVTDDGKVYPLIKDDGARMFFKDERLRGRPMRLTARPFGSTSLLQVVRVHSIRDRELYEVYYWCDICSIQRFEKQICDCCGALMELRERKVKE